jgi:pyruvate/oxaloacetate carboxyltransferase
MKNINRRGVPAHNLTDIRARTGDIFANPTMGGKRIKSFAAALRSNISKYQREIRKILKKVDIQKSKLIADLTLENIEEYQQFYNGVVIEEQQKLNILLILLGEAKAWLAEAEKARYISVGHWYRDNMQSTGLWCFDAEQVKKIIQLSYQTGFTVLEAFGGQSFQIALKHTDKEGNDAPVQPFEWARFLKQCVDEVAHKRDIPLTQALQNAKISINGDGIGSFRDLLKRLKVEENAIARIIESDETSLEPMLTKKGVDLKTLWDIVDILQGPQKQTVNNHSMALQWLVRASMFSFENRGSTVAQMVIKHATKMASDPNPSAATCFRVFCALNDPRNLEEIIRAVVRNNIIAGKQNLKINEARAAYRHNLIPAEERSADWQEMVVDDEAFQMPLQNLAHVQAGMSYSPRFSAQYYVKYAKKLMAIANDERKKNGGKTLIKKNGEEKMVGLGSIAIKSFAGDLLDPVEAVNLIRELKKLGLAVHLHLHATDLVKSTIVLLRSIEKACVDGIEVSAGCLQAGTAHHNVRTAMAMDDNERLVPINEEMLTQLEQAIEEGHNKGVGRIDISIDEQTRAKFASLGIAGGAIPFFISDMMKNLAAPYFKVKHEQLAPAQRKQITDDVLEAMDELQQKLGYPCLVTPVMDIVNKQAIWNVLTKKTNIAPIFDPRSCRLVLGYYGDFINHETGAKIVFDEDLTQEVIKYCADNAATGTLPPPHKLEKHSTEIIEDEWEHAISEVRAILEGEPDETFTEEEVEQLTIIHILRPAETKYRDMVSMLVNARQQKRLGDKPIVLCQTLLELFNKDTFSLIKPGKSLFYENSEVRNQINAELVKFLGGKSALRKITLELMEDANAEKLKKRLQELSGNIQDDYIDKLVGAKCLQQRKHGEIENIELITNMVKQYLLTRMTLLVMTMADKINNGKPLPEGKHPFDLFKVRGEIEKIKTELDC